MMSASQLDDVSRETCRVSLFRGAESLGVALSAENCNRLLNYLDLLLKWNRVYNLTSIRNIPDMVSLHLLDSMSVLPALDVLSKDAPVRLLDIGAGAGLPGLVLASLRPDWSVTLIDAVQKKAAFMTQAIGELGLKNCRAVHGRVEQHTNTQKYNLIVSRAFSDISLFARLASDQLEADGFLCAMRGKIDANLTMPTGWEEHLFSKLVIPDVSAERHLIVLRSLKG
ncbi:MAG: 16S rRNA (guanine(527)-N(7))-methyltransferase RsmG [Burkholderiales bacterium]|jgi:16S rRNA (guanine527-N7)-methyltransferase|nr:16S rRNA (guanine(527)-N(7))-methyltransferase RsmG [Burkholderiales bacterium]